jgi:hypothetical protein
VHIGGHLRNKFALTLNFSFLTELAGKKGYL